MCRPCSHWLIGSSIHLFIQQTLCIINHMPCKEDLQYALILTLSNYKDFSFLPFRADERSDKLDFDYFPESLGRKIQEYWLSFIVRNQNLSAVSLQSQILCKKKKYFNWIIFYISRYLYSISLSSIIIFNIICMCQVNCSGNLFGSLKINLSL